MESLDLSKVSFVVDADGHKTGAILPFELYQQLLSLKMLVDEAALTAEQEETTAAPFNFKVKKAKASGYPSGEKNKPKFVIVKGSTANASGAESLRPAILSLRNSMVEKQILCLSDGVYRFMQDYEFSSPSAAACLVAGNARSGLDAWLDQWGKSLKQLGYGKSS